MDIFPESTLAVRSRRQTKLSRVNLLTLVAVQMPTPARAQEEFGFDIVNPSSLPVWQDVATWIGLGIVVAGLWTLARAVAETTWFSGVCRRARYYWPTLMLGCLWLTIEPIGRPVEQPWASVCDLLEFSFYAINTPVLVVVGAFGQMLWELGGFGLPRWLPGLTFWATWYVVLSYLGSWDSRKKPLALGIAQQQ